MTCQDCIHYDVCQFHIDEETTMTVNECSHGFKPKSRFVELPCEIGQTVYTINKERIKGHWENDRWIVYGWDKWKVCEIPFSLTLFECGKGTYYITKEEAENVLKEREKQ